MSIENINPIPGDKDGKLVNLEKELSEDKTKLLLQEVENLEKEKDTSSSEEHKKQEGDNTLAEEVKPETEPSEKLKETGRPSEEGKKEKGIKEQIEELGEEYRKCEDPDKKDEIKIQQIELTKKLSELKNQAGKYLAEQLVEDTSFFAKKLTSKEFDAWQERAQTDFNHLSKEKQDILMNILKNEWGKVSNQIEEAKNELGNKTIDETKKQQLENNLKYLQNLQKAARARTQAYHLVLHLEKTPEFQPTQKKEQGKENKKKEEEKPTKEEIKEQQEGKTKEKQEQEEPASLKIVNHFQEEFKKLEDFPDQKEYQKYNKCNEALNLIKDWLPFGYLDDFQGITKILSVMEASKPKTALSFGHIQENTAQKITYEMAFQYKMWELDNTAKTKAIHNFIDEWLKEKSFYYQAGENWKDFWGTKSEGYSQSRAENGYFFEGNVGGKAKDRLEPDKLWQSFGFSTGNLIKLSGGRDRTLSETCKILAAQGVVYDDLRPLMNSIENQFIKQRTDSQIMDIEEQTDNKKLTIFLEKKKRIGTLPTKPLKVEYLKQLIEEQIANKEIPPKQMELLINVIANNKEILKNKEARDVLKTFQTKIEGLSQKQTTKEQSELSSKEQRVITKAEEFIKDKEKKKESIWGQAGTAASCSLFLLLILFFVGEMWTLEKLTGTKTKEKK